MLARRTWMVRVLLPLMVVLVMCASLYAGRGWWRRQAMNEARPRAVPMHSTDLIDDTAAAKRGEQVRLAAKPPIEKATKSPVVEDILSIRAADGSPRDPVEEGEFAEALRRLVEEKERSTLPTERRRERELDPMRSFDAVSHKLETANALRQSARHFDEVAADHEDVANYAAADAARETASALRKEARQLEAPSAHDLKP